MISIAANHPNIRHLYDANFPYHRQNPTLAADLIGEAVKTRTASEISANGRL